MLSGANSSDTLRPSYRLLTYWLSSPVWPPQERPAGCIRAAWQLSNQTCQLSLSICATCNMPNKFNREARVTRRCENVKVAASWLTTPTTWAGMRLHTQRLCLSSVQDAHDCISLQPVRTLSHPSLICSTSHRVFTQQFHQRVKVGCLSQATQTWPYSLFLWRKSS